MSAMRAARSSGKHITTSAALIVFAAHHREMSIFTMLQTPQLSLSFSNARLLAFRYVTQQEAPIAVATLSHFVV